MCFFIYKTEKIIIFTLLMMIHFTNSCQAFKNAPGSKQFVDLWKADLSYLLAPPIAMILPRFYPEEIKKLAKSYCLDHVGKRQSISETTLIKVFLSCFPYCFCNLHYNWTIYSIRQWPWALRLVPASHSKSIL